jgi:predicted ATPase
VTASHEQQPQVAGVTFRRKERCFGRGRKITFRPGVNLLVGDQGAGKSTVIGLLAGLGSARDFERDRVKAIIDVQVTRACPLLTLDFEKDNLRTLSHFVEDTGTQLAMMFRSHGESVNAMLEGVLHKARAADTPPVVLLDEPDMALSPRSAYKLAGLLQDLADCGAQVICAVHNPIVISSQPHVLSLEHKKWMTSDAFLDAHATGS